MPGLSFALLLAALPHHLTLAGSTSRGGEHGLSWSKDGRELAVLSDKQLVVLDVADLSVQRTLAFSAAVTTLGEHCFAAAVLDRGGARVVDLSGSDMKILFRAHFDNRDGPGEDALALADDCRRLSFGPTDDPLLLFDGPSRPRTMDATVSAGPGEGGRWVQIPLCIAISLDCACARHFPTKASASGSAAFLAGARRVVVWQGSQNHAAKWGLHPRAFDPRRALHRVDLGARRWMRSGLSGSRARRALD